MLIAHELNPDVVIISAGSDAADGEELGRCFVNPPCYSHITHMLMSLANALRSNLSYGPRISYMLLLAREYLGMTISMLLS